MKTALVAAAIAALCAATPALAADTAHRKAENPGPVQTQRQALLSLSPRTTPRRIPERVGVRLARAVSQRKSRAHQTAKSRTAAFQQKARSQSNNFGGVLQEQKVGTNVFLCINRPPTQIERTELSSALRLCSAQPYCCQSNWRKHEKIGSRRVGDPRAFLPCYCPNG